MSDTSYPDENLPVSGLGRINKVCGEFESVWKSGEQPRIQDYLARVDGAERRQLLRELILLDLEYRESRGEALSPSEYLSEFPRQAAAVETAFVMYYQSADEPDSGPVPAARELASTSIFVEKNFNPLYECRDCHQLVKTQEHLGDTIVPQFCPWCGQTVESLLGRELDGYRIDEVLARGGFGIVYLASNLTQASIKAVVKVLDPHITYSQPDFVRIFLREARLTEEIGQTCWNVVRVSNVRAHPWPYFLMEYIRGKTIDDYVRETLPRNLPIADCVGYLQGIATALTATHARGGVHRDLKPSNIMVMLDEKIQEPSERIKVLDFGLALPVAASAESAQLTGLRTEAGDDAHQTRLSLVGAGGTPEYMAPEAWEGEKGFATDIYSFGATAYEILTGKHPWKDPSAGENRLKYWRMCHEETPPIPIRELRPEVPKWLADVVMECLEKDPEERIHDSDDLRKRLTPPVPRWVWAAAAAVALVILGLAWTSLRASLRTDYRLGSWEGELAMERGSTVWVNSAEKLVGKRIEADLDATARAEHTTADFAWSSRPSGLTIEPTGDRLVIRFPDDASECRVFLDRTITITGSRGLIARSMVRADVSVKLDDRDPVLNRSEFQVETEDGVKRELSDLDRLSSAHALIVDLDVSDESFSNAELVLEGGVLEGKFQNNEKTVWRFSLDGLSDGGYQARLKIIDLAGNAFIDSREVAFSIDQTAELELGSEFLDDGMVFYGITLKEKLAAVEVVDETTGKTITSRFYPVPEDAGIPDRTKALPLEKLELGKDYSMGFVVPLEGNKFDRGGDFSFSVKYRDLALRPNSGSKLEKLSIPERLSPPEFQSLTLDFQDPSVGPLETRLGQSPDDISLSLSEELAGKTLAIRRLVVRFSRPDRVRVASCALNGDPLRAEVSEREAVFEGLFLKVDESNALALTFWDSLRRKLSYEIEIFPFAKLPGITLVQRSVDRSGQETVIRQRSTRRYHRVESGDSISVEVTSSDPVRGIAIRRAAGQRAASQWFDLHPVESTRDGLRTEFKLDSLAPLDLEAGPHSLELRITDRADERRVIPRPWAVTLNPGPPSIFFPSFDLETSDRLTLGEKTRLRLQVKDGNGVQRDKVEARIEIDDQAPIRLGIKALVSGPKLKEDDAPAEANFWLDLVAIPKDRCQGDLIVTVEDAAGLADTKSHRFTFDRRNSYQNFVEEYKGLRWVRAVYGERTFYISQTEIPNSALLELGYVRRDGKPGYYWTEDGRPPAYRRGGNLLDGGPFPAVGLTPEEAEAFGRLLGEGVRLPLYKEWLAAARLETSRDSEFPWPKELGDLDLINCKNNSKRLDSPLAGKHADWMRVNGKWVQCHLIPVDKSQSPFPKGFLNKGEPGPRLLWHQLGNVSEYVVLESGGGPGKSSYRFVGGDVETLSRNVGLTKQFNPYDRKYHYPSMRIGFRLVIEPERNVEFRRQALEE